MTQAQLESVKEALWGESTDELTDVLAWSMLAREAVPGRGVAR